MNRFFSLSVIPLAATATVASVMMASAPAQAIIFAPGDFLSGNTSFKVIGDSATSLNFDFLNNGVAGTPTGTFGIDSTSTGAFVPYINSAALNDTDYQIKDADFSTVTSIPDFLSFNDGVGGSDDWSIDWTNIVVKTDVSAGDLRFLDFDGLAVFKGSNTINGTGGLTGLITINKKTGTGLVSFEPVPEPLTILGTGIALGFGGLFKSKSSKKQSVKA